MIVGGWQIFLFSLLAAAALAALVGYALAVPDDEDDDPWSEADDR